MNIVTYPAFDVEVRKVCGAVSVCVRTLSVMGGCFSGSDAPEEVEGEGKLWDVLSNRQEGCGRLH